MKVLELTTNMSMGSVSRIVSDLYNVITEADECVVAYGRGECPSYIKNYKIGNKFSVYTDAFFSRITDKAGLYSKRATRKLLKYLDEYEPDVIHIHCLHGYYVNYRILFEYIKKQEIPVVWTFHDCWAFTGHCTFFDRVDCNKWKNGCDKCIQKSTYPASLFWDNSKINYEIKKSIFSNINKLTIVTPSEWLAKLVKESFFESKDIRVINNGIDTSVFKYTSSDYRKKYSLQNKKIVLGVANIWDKRKGLDVFLKLVDVLSDDYRIVLIGCDREQLGKYGDSILSIKRTNSREELAKWYSIADAFVNPTLEDNYPTVNLEAIACGTPVITYDTGGSGECLKFGKGILVKKGDFEDLVRGIKEVCNKTGQKETMFDKVNKTYCFNQYISLFKEILDE